MRSATYRSAALAAACTLSLFDLPVSAGITYLQSSSTATLTHDANSSSGGVDVTKVLAPPPSSSMTLYQLNSNIGATPNSLAKCSVGAVTNSTTATFTLAAGTGVTQNDPSHVWGPSVLKAAVNGVWQGSSPSFGPIATGYFSLTYAGTVTGAGFAKVKINLSFLDANNSSISFRPAISFTETLGTGTFAKTYTSSYVLNTGSITSGSKMRVTGTIELQAENSGGPVELYPVNSDFGGAPPTATWQVDGGGTWANNVATPWTPNPLNNTIDDPNAEIPAIPNVIGQRARFANLSLTPSGPRTINVTTPITLGTLDLSDDDPLTFTSAPGASLTFAVQQGSAVMHSGDTDGDTEGTVLAAMSLVSPTEVQTDAGSETFSSVSSPNPPPDGGNPHHSQIHLLGVISSPNPAAGLRKTGDGLLQIGGAAPNTFAGGVSIEEGVVDGDKAQAMGTGLTTVSDSRFNYNANFAAPAGTHVVALGETNIGDTVVLNGSFNNEHFSVDDLGAIRGSALELQALNAQPGGNLAIEPGALIVHEDFNPGTIGNPSGLLDFPAYTFGIGNNVTGVDFTVGTTAVPGIWRGLGGDRGFRVFGTPSDTLTISGDADLVSLAGALTINAHLASAGGASQINIRGGGCVVLNNASNSFSGSIHVNSGIFLVNGSLPNALVQLTPNLPSHPATLAGTGSIGGPVSVGPGGHLSPGAPTSTPAGTFQLAQLDLDANAELDFDLGLPYVIGSGVSDLINIDGALTLDGKLNIYALDDFGPGTYTLMQFGGTLINNGLDIGYHLFDYPYQIVIENFPGGGGNVLLVVPEPASLTLAASGLLMLRRRRR